MTVVVHYLLNWVSLVAQWSRIRLPMQEKPVGFLGGGRPPGGGNGNLLQHYCGESPMDTRAWQATSP